MNRRQFLEVTAATAVWQSTVSPCLAADTAPTASKLPRWRGFNLLEKYIAEHQAPFRESDFAWTAEWGFNFVRLPLSYRCWSDARDWRQMREPVLKEIDQAVELGRRYRIHVCLNFHRAPGYCVNPPAEPLDLWTQERALEACAFHWRHFAERYRGIPNTRLSFNLLNEPAKVAETTYVRVVRGLLEAIRERDPERLIIADGLEWGRVPVHGLVDLRIAQSTRGYDPMPVTHYNASWVKGSDRWPVPTWPLTDQRKKHWDRETLRRERIDSWKRLEANGIGIHVGEWGAFQHTPHPVTLAWMRDSLELWQQAGWGWALWNLRGGFGILDSERRDVTYENFHGHKLDRKMLELLRSL
jgi:endoglucanase